MHLARIEYIYGLLCRGDRRDNWVARELDMSHEAT